ncbi:MAG: hypothetical protein AB2556_21235, partial [Candidatus Thiodiazotropha sp.]
AFPSGGAREAPAMDHAVIPPQIAEDIDIVDERQKPRERAQVRAAQVPGQIVDLSDVGEEVAFVRDVQEKVGDHCLYGP